MKEGNGGVCTDVLNEARNDHHHDNDHGLERSKSRSLLVEALNNIHESNTATTTTTTSSSISSYNGDPTTNVTSTISPPRNGLLSSFNLVETSMLPKHSDFTIPTSNVSPFTPETVRDATAATAHAMKRLVFGQRVEAKYHHSRFKEDSSKYNSNTLSNQSHFNSNSPVSKFQNLSSTFKHFSHQVLPHKNQNNYIVQQQKGPIMPPQQDTTFQIIGNVPDASTAVELTPSKLAEMETNNRGFVRSVSDLTPPSSPTARRSIASTPTQELFDMSPLTPFDQSKRISISRRNSLSNVLQDVPQQQSNSKEKRALRVHETLHAQSFLLGFAFLAIWSPQNCMAPNLTQMATEFGFSDAERDFYLGANVALATGVLSLPISAGIGILADLWNRKYLFCGTVALGGLTAFLTGASRSYNMLYLARLINGGCMSGSVPVAFSLLGDLFDTNERNAASSGLTAMMGMGIILGQVYAGVVGSSQGWPHAFYASAALTLFSALLVLLFVREPVRGGKEEVLQHMLKNGTQYERKLTWKGFMAAMGNNDSNINLMWQGFFTGVPWGIIFVFLNDYLSQERGFSVPDATYLVAVFGAGCAAGGVLGGYWGQVFQSKRVSYLPLFMGVTTFLGIFPFLGLLNGHYTDAHGITSIFYAFMGGFVASLPSVNVRPCILNVNPPETRGAALTAANLIINLARGAGPSAITILTAIFHVSRQFSFNLTLIVFWTITAIQLFFLAGTLPRDQSAMESELAAYAASAIKQANQRNSSHLDEESTIVSIEDRMTSFDAGAARESIRFIESAFREIGSEIRTLHRCRDQAIPEESDEETTLTPTMLNSKRQEWIANQQEQRQLTTKDNEDDWKLHKSSDCLHPSETTPLV